MLHHRLRDGDVCLTHEMLYSNTQRDTTHNQVLYGTCRRMCHLHCNARALLPTSSIRRGMLSTSHIEYFGFKVDLCILF